MMTIEWCNDQRFLSLHNDYNDNVKYLEQPKNTMKTIRQLV